MLILKNCLSQYSSKHPDEGGDFLDQLDKDQLDKIYLLSQVDFGHRVL
ncbi:hypothetical protein [Trichothermofontia sp.]